MTWPWLMGPTLVHVKSLGTNEGSTRNEFASRKLTSRPCGVLRAVIPHIVRLGTGASVSVPQTSQPRNKPDSVSYVHISLAQTISPPPTYCVIRFDFLNLGSGTGNTVSACTQPRHGDAPSRVESERPEMTDIFHVAAEEETR